MRQEPHAALPGQVWRLDSGESPQWRLWNALIRALARALRRKRLLEEGRYRSAAEIAQAEDVTRSFVNRLLRLTLLAPDIVEAILDGLQPGMALEELTRAMPSGWGEQCEVLPSTMPCEARQEATR